VAVVALVLAACSHSSSPSPGATPTPGSSFSPGPSASPCINTNGVAYVPDGANNGAAHGVQVVHFEDNSGLLCGAATAVPQLVTFNAPVGPFVVSPDGSVALALLQNSAGAFTFVQDVFDVSAANPIPVGGYYDVSMLPTAVPSASPTPAVSPAPIVPDAYSLSIFGSSTQSEGLTTGPAAAGVLGITSLTNAPPQFGGFAPYSSGTGGARTTVHIVTDASGNTSALVRGPNDILAYSVQIVPTGYQFTQTARDATLGTAGQALRGNGNFAIDPADATRALLANTTSATNVLTLVTGLPSKITISSQIALPSAPHSVAFTSNGKYALVGTDAGILVVVGVSSTSLAIVAPFAPSGSSGQADSPAYTDCNGTARNLVNIASVGQSLDAAYLVALSRGVTGCPSGYDGTLVALPFNPTTGSTPSPAPSTSPVPSASPMTPAPKMFTQNNVFAPPVNADYLNVR
jgi:hypothetical protein